MKKEELLKLSPAELIDLGICPTCFNRENGGAIYGDNSDKMLYEDEDIECFFVGNPRADVKRPIASTRRSFALQKDLCRFFVRSMDVNVSTCVPCAMVPTTIITFS